MQGVCPLVNGCSPIYLEDPTAQGSRGTAFVKVSWTTTLKIKDWKEQYTILALYEDVPQRASLNTI